MNKNFHLDWNSLSALTLALQNKWRKKNILLYFNIQIAFFIFYVQDLMTHLITMKLQTNNWLHLQFMSQQWKRALKPKLILFCFLSSANAFNNQNVTSKDHNWRNKYSQSKSNMIGFVIQAQWNLGDCFEINCLVVVNHWLLQSDINGYQAQEDNKSLKVHWKWNSWALRRWDVWGQRLSDQATDWTFKFKHQEFRCFWTINLLMFPHSLHEYIYH